MKNNKLEKKFSWGFDDAYASSPCFFGRAADRILALNLQFAPRGKALDLGCGEGRNALYLAQEGFEVIGLDKAREGLKKMRRLAEEYGLSSKVKTVLGDFREMNLGREVYALVVSAYALVYCRRKELLEVICKIKRALQPGGVCISPA